MVTGQTLGNSEWDIICLFNFTLLNLLLSADSSKIAILF